MHVRIRHETRHRYDGPTAIGPHLSRFHPARHTRTRVLACNLEVRSEPELRWQEDPWGNRLARVTYPAGRRVERPAGATVSRHVDSSLDRVEERRPPPPCPSSASSTAS